MGLDITAYSHLKHVGPHEKDPALNEGEPGGPNAWCYYENHVEAFAYDCFPASYRGLPVLRTERGFVFGGCYETTEETKMHSFCAGSYGGYNRWREALAEQFNAPVGKPDPAKPFYELIWFSDNEGTIGPETAQDLLADFREHADVWRSPFESHRDLYNDWLRAFELAADGGLVRFH